MSLSQLRSDVLIYEDFFYPRGQRDMRATRQGIALKLSEWVQMADIIETINQNHVFDN